MMNKRYLPIIALFITMLLVSLNAFAHEIQSAAVQDGCACHLLDHASGETDGQSGHNPDSHGEGGCGCEECCSDAMDPSVFSCLRVTVSVNQLVPPCPDSFFPIVYLSIFVPPENSSLI
jgi:hypothetical protein